MDEWKGWNGRYDGKPRPLTGSLILLFGLTLIVIGRSSDDSIPRALSQSLAPAVLGVVFGLAACFIDMTLWRSVSWGLGPEYRSERRAFWVRHLALTLVLLVTLALVVSALPGDAYEFFVSIFAFQGTLMACGFRGPMTGRPPRPARPDQAASRV